MAKSKPVQGGQDQGTATEEKKKPGRKSKADLHEQAQREAAEQADRERRQWAETQTDLKVLETIEVDPLELVYNRDIQGRFGDGVNPERVHDLADSIRTEGQLSPIQVRKYGDKYEVIYGYTRGRAGALIKTGYPARDGKTQVPANPNFKLRAEVVECSDDEAVKRNVTENVHRTDLSPIDLLMNVKRLKDMGMTDLQIAPMIGQKSSATVTRIKKLDGLTDDIKDRVHRREITAQAAYMLAECPQSKQEKIMELIDAEKLAELDKLTPEQRAKREAEGDDNDKGIGAQDVLKHKRKLDAEEREAKKAAEAANQGQGGEGQPAGDQGGAGNATGDGTGGGSGGSGTTPPEKTYTLTVKQVKDGLTQLAKDDGVPPRASQLFGLLLDWVEGKSDGVKAIADFAKLHLTDAADSKRAE